MDGKDSPRLKIVLFPSKSEHPKAPKYDICLSEDDGEQGSPF
jgi:hypothetical protein